ncbi:AAA family ATPase [Marinobacter nauticus]|uniref:Chromosome segregation protein SMC n=1 Tax=Marinobacter nauticus TaxID=2743 RepID=A0A1M2UWW8_MARNT|nr:AAA family ATPase [Marinobacter nauticus]OJS99841.1 chromosome segregation protein SMC [Marinobacter nauticus]
MFLKALRLKGLLSFGSATETVPLGNLNILIGPNGSGKSNFIEAIDLLRSAPSDFRTVLSDGGGVRDWLWKGGHQNKYRTALLDAVLANPNGPQPLRYCLEFREEYQRFTIEDERVENENPVDGHENPYFFYHFNGGRPTLNVKGDNRELRQEDIELNRSILAQRKDPDQYPEITYLGKALGKIGLYREWSFGRFTKPRIPQKADLPNEHLLPDASNLGLVLNRLRREPEAKQKLLEALGNLYEGIDDFDVQIEGGTVQVFFQEGRNMIPATRLSDGTLRYLCLLAILCHPQPQPLICLEEPELGLHPDILPVIADLLIETSERTQLIVTTHSDVLVDAMTNQPESILICERDIEQGTRINRLNREELQPWLENYRLGQLWTSGELGGTRW